MGKPNYGGWDLDGFSLDRPAMDVIGYDMVPAPGTALALAPVALLAARRRRATLSAD